MYKIRTSGIKLVRNNARLSTVPKNDKVPIQTINDQTIHNSEQVNKNQYDDHDDNFTTLHAMTNAVLFLALVTVYTS